MYDDYGALYIPPGHGRIGFGRQELMHITISVVVLTFAFSMALFSQSSLSLLGNGNVDGFLFVLGISALAVISGFLLHELAHKVVAQRYGAWAEFRIFPMGLLLALVFSFLGFVFAAPGAVYINGRLSWKQNGLVSIAGIATNIVLGAVFFALSLAYPVGDVGLILQVLATINLFLAVFNLLPIPPLDGSKVLKWNKGIWVGTLAIGIVLLLFAWGII
jgi:Zn-dependent protease